MAGGGQSTPSSCFFLPLMQQLSSHAAVAAVDSCGSGRNITHVRQPLLLALAVAGETTVVASFRGSPWSSRRAARSSQLRRQDPHCALDGRDQGRRGREEIEEEGGGGGPARWRPAARRRIPADGADLADSGAKGAPGNHGCALLWEREIRGGGGEKKEKTKEERQLTCGPHM